MISLFSYIFYKSYSLCINVFKEKEFPEYFASGVIAMITVGTIIVIIDIALYQVNPSLINMVFGYYKYFSLGSVLFFWWFFGYKKKYMNFMNRYDKMSANKKQVLSIISILYLVVLVVSFFGMGNIMRDYNLSNR